MTSLNTEIRSFLEQDRAAVVEIKNRNRPAHRFTSCAIWKRFEKMSIPTEVTRRYVVGSPAQAYASMTDLNTSSWKMEDVCEFELNVSQSAEHQGARLALYEQVEAFARERGAKRLMTTETLRPGHEHAAKFLEEQGFAEQERERPSFISLVDFRPESFQDAMGKAADNGVVIRSYADVEDTEENRRNYFDVFGPCIYDIPRNDTQPFTMSDFEQFQKELFTGDEDRNLMIFAEKDGKWLGLTLVMPRPGTKHAMQWLTGVLKEARGLGIATAMKVYSYTKAKELGYETISTENHIDNGPMLAINKKFGFIAEPPIVVFNKVL